MSRSKSQECTARSLEKFLGKGGLPQGMIKLLRSDILCSFKILGAILLKRRGRKDIRAVKMVKFMFLIDWDLKVKLECLRENSQSD